MKLLTLAMALCALSACASNPSLTSVPRANAIPSGLPLGCVPKQQTQRCDEFGVYYSGDDLRKTGAQHVGAALSQVDPEIGH
jgi:hypothetical protein